MCRRKRLEYRAFWGEIIMELEAIQAFKILNNLKNKGFITLLSLMAEDLSPIETDISGGENFRLTYTLYNPVLKEFKEIQTIVNAEMRSVSTLFKSAKYDEMEIYDLFGIKFKNHPKLDRIFLDKNFVGHPLRNNYKMPETQTKKGY